MVSADSGMALIPSWNEKWIHTEAINSSIVHDQPVGVQFFPQSSDLSSRTTTKITKVWRIGRLTDRHGHVFRNSMRRIENALGNAINACDSSKDALLVASATNTMDDSRWRRHAVAVNRQNWARRDSNPRPSDYESPALTTELRAPTISSRLGYPIAVATQGSSEPNRDNAAYLTVEASRSSAPPGRSAIATGASLWTWRHLDRFSSAGAIDGL